MSCLYNMMSRTKIIAIFMAVCLIAAAVPNGEHHVHVDEAYIFCLLAIRHLLSRLLNAWTDGDYCSKRTLSRKTDVSNVCF